MHWEPLLLAVILLVISFFAGQLFLGPAFGPATRGSTYSATAMFVWKNFPALYRFGQKTLLLLWIVLMLGMAGYCVKLAFTQ